MSAARVRLALLLVAFVLGVGLLGASLLGPWGAARAAAPEPGPSAKEIGAKVRRMIAEPPFRSVATEHRWTFKGPDWFESDAREAQASEAADLAWLTDVLGLLVTIASRATEVVLWTVVAVLVVLAIVYRRKWLPLAFPHLGARRRPPLPLRVAGLALEPETLPDDVAAAAWAAWRQGESRACLSLLYRGALAELVLNHGVSLPDGATEADCVRRVRSRAPDAPAAYFEELTAAWQLLAYGGALPAAPAAQELCLSWRRCFRAPT